MAEDERVVARKVANQNFVLWNELLWIMGKCKTWTLDSWTGLWTGLCSGLQTGVWTGVWTGLWTRNDHYLSTVITVRNAEQPSKTVKHLNFSDVRIMKHVLDDELKQKQFT